MSNYIIEQKSRYTAAGIHALREGNNDEAFVQFGKAAECALHLAEQTDGVVKQAYLANSRELVELAQRSRQKGTTTNKVRQVTENAAPSSSDSDEIASARASQWILLEKPTERFKDVAGLEEVKLAIKRDILNPMKRGDVYRKLKISPDGGALLYGPPGNGKTFISRAIAGELDATFFSVSGGQIKNKYVGETEKNMRALFEEAAKYERAVIFIDEIHSLLGRRGNEKVNAVDEFLVLSDGIIKRKNNLFILGATNDPWLLHDAVFRRLKKLIYVGLPDREACKKIFELQFDGVPRECYEDLPFDEYADRSQDLFSGDDIKQICSTAKKLAAERVIDTESDDPVVKKQDVSSAMEAMIPTVRPEIIEKYRQWRDALTKGGGALPDLDN